jgi:hypothetical protein
MLLLPVPCHHKSIFAVTGLSKKNAPFLMPDNKKNRALTFIRGVFPYIAHVKKMLTYLNMICKYPL